MASAGTAILGGFTYLLIRKIVNNNKFADLMLFIQEGQAQEKGEIGYLKAFDIKWYDTPDPQKRAIIKYTTAKVNELVDKLYKASTRLMTDENTIYSIYNSMESMKKMAQVAKAFGIKYGISLLDRLTNALDKSEKKKLFAIIATKPDVQFA